MYSAEHIAQFKSQLPQPKSKWAVRPKQEWYHKHGSDGLDDPRQACPDWLWLEALPVWQQKYSTLGEQGNWQEKYRARCLLCERHLEAATSCGKNSWVNGDGLDPEFYKAEAYQTLRTAKQHGRQDLHHYLCARCPTPGFTSHGPGEPITLCSVTPTRM